MISALIATVLILSFALAVEARPFLVCAPYPGVTGYSVSLDDGRTWRGEPLVTGGDYGFKVDLGELSPGPHKIKARACNAAGCGERSLYRVQRSDVWSSPSPGTIRRATTWKPGRD